MQCVFYFRLCFLFRTTVFVLMMRFSFLCWSDFAMFVFVVMLLLFFDSLWICVCLVVDVFFCRCDVRIVCSFFFFLRLSPYVFSDCDNSFMFVVVFLVNRLICYLFVFIEGLSTYCSWKRAWFGQEKQSVWCFRNSFSFSIDCSVFQCFYCFVVAICFYVCVVLFPFVVLFWI